MRGISKFADTVLSANVLTTSSPNFSQFGPGAADLELEMHVLLAYFLLSRNSEKIQFGGITPGEKPQRNQLSI